MHILLGESALLYVPSVTSGESDLRRFLLRRFLTTQTRVSTQGSSVECHGQSGNGINFSPNPLVFHRSSILTDVSSEGRKMVPLRARVQTTSQQKHQNKWYSLTERTPLCKQDNVIWKARPTEQPGAKVSPNHRFSTQTILQNGNYLNSLPRTVKTALVQILKQVNKIFSQRFLER